MASALLPFPVGRNTPSPDELEHAHRPRRIQAVCLDIDDTLVDFTSSARCAFRELTGHDDLWPRWQRMTDEHVAKVVAGEMDSDTMRNARTKAFFAELGALLDDDIVAAIERRRLARLNRAWRLYEDTLPCLDWLRAAGLRIAAITNASGAHQRAKLDALGITRFFDTIAVAGELGVAKPDPLIFEVACHRLGVPVEEALHVGDRLDVDALGAVRAGMHGVWLNRDGSENSPTGGTLADAEREVHVIESLADLPTLLVTEFLTPAVSSRATLPEQERSEPISGDMSPWSNMTDRQHGPRPGATGARTAHASGVWCNRQHD